MTAIEFFDRTPIENIISSITTVPDKIIFVGDSKMMKKFDQRFKTFLENRNINIELEYRHIKKNDINNIIEVLSDVVENNDECVFDLTGGEDLVLVAMGIVYQKYKDKNIQLQRFNVRNSVVIDCDNDGNIIYTGKPSISVEENVLICGGKIRYGFTDDQKERTFLWNLDDDFIRDINLMWEICRKDPGYWNARTSVLETIETLQKDETSLTVCVNISSLKDYLRKNNLRFVPISGLLYKLSNAHLIKNFVDDGESISFEYKNEQVKKCLIKSGTILELKVLLAAKLSQDKDGSDYYNDCMTGVYIDWDGIFHNESDIEKDTENEIDVFLMRGTVPVLISCKNGHVYDDELYKLDAVASRFGGLYAKKVLIATYLGKKTESLSYFKYRAKDMHINLIDSVHTLSDEKFNRMIKHIANC